jgi:hypothetical protein
MLQVEPIPVVMKEGIIHLLRHKQPPLPLPPQTSLFKWDERRSEVTKRDPFIKTIRSTSRQEERKTVRTLGSWVRYLLEANTCFFVPSVVLPSADKDSLMTALTSKSSCRMTYWCVIHWVSSQLLQARRPNRWWFKKETVSTELTSDFPFDTQLATLLGSRFKESRWNREGILNQQNITRNSKQHKRVQNCARELGGVRRWIWQRSLTFRSYFLPLSSG